jgi:hypothetical protein
MAAKAKKLRFRSASKLAHSVGRNDQFLQIAEMASLAPVVTIRPAALQAVVEVQGQFRHRQALDRHSGHWA